MMMAAVTGPTLESSRRPGKTTLGRIVDFAVYQREMRASFHSYLVSASATQ
jgi:hypothetical protein